MAQRVGVQRRDGVVLLTVGGAAEGVPGAGFDVALRRALDAALTEAFATPNLRALVLRAGAGGWPVALDPAGDFSATAPTLSDLAERLAQAPVPVVAVLTGLIAAGGLALAQAAGLRLALASTRFVSAEAGLGFLPAAGTVVRLARRAGGAAALDFLLSGQTRDAQAAMRIGLCDAVASEGTIETAALTEALRVAALGAEAPFAPRDGGMQAPGPALEALAEVRARLQADAPLAAVAARIAEVAEAALLLPFGAALDFEAVAFDDLIGAEPSRALRALAAARHSCARLDCEVAGTAGAVPAAVALWNGPDRLALALLGRGGAVQLGASTPERLQALLTGVAEAQAAAVAAGRVTPARRDADWARLEPVAGAGGFGPTDLLLAAPATAAELASLRQSCPAGAVLALSGATPGPGELGIDRCRGMAAIWAGRPEGEAHLPRLAAVLRADGTVVVQAQAMVLRLEAQYFAAAERAVLAGATPAEVDAALLRWGFAEAPFARLDRLGLPLVSTRLLAAGLRGGALMAALAGHGRTGRAAGAGVYAYAADGSATPWPDEAAWLAALRTGEGITPQRVTAEEIVARVVAELAGLGAAALHSGAARRPGDIDLLAGAELGFPRTRGGPMFQADRIGALALRKRLRALAAEGGADPAPLLDELIRDGASFAERFAPAAPPRM